MVKSRIIELDREKGVAILLVVMAHSMLALGDHLSADVMRSGHFLFRCGLVVFFFISGMMYRHSSPDKWTWPTYGAMFFKKASRILVPFLFYILLMCSVKIVGNIMHLNIGDPVRGLQDFILIILAPGLSPVTSGWFFLVLFLFYLSTPLFEFVTRGSKFNLFLIFTFLTFLPNLPRILGLNFFQAFAPFFFLGYALAPRYTQYDKLIERYQKVLIFLFIIFFLLIPQLARLNLNMAYRFFFIPSLHAIMKLDVWKGRDVLSFIGQYSLNIYIFNLVAIGFTKAMIQMIAGIDSENLVLVYLILIVMGVSIPILLKKYVLMRKSIVLIGKYI